jgi:5-methylthioadenosine/S-adenosylhomocysteine deaminase
MIRGGTTTYCDMYYFEDAVADETAKAGVRGVLGETIIDFPVADNKTYEEGLAYTQKYIEKWRGHALITPAIAPHAPYTVSEEHLKAARDLANRLRATIVIHVAETQKEVDDITRDHGRVAGQLSGADRVFERSGDRRAHHPSHGRRDRAAQAPGRGRGA